MLFKHYLRFVDAIRPKVAVLENVKLLTSMKNSAGRLVKDDICKEFDDHGYHVQCFDVNAKEYGAPQHRERVIFVALRNDLGIAPTLPARTRCEEANLFSNSLAYRTFGDACSDLPFIEAGGSTADPLHRAVNHPTHVIEWLWDVPEGRSGTSKTKMHLAVHLQATTLHISARCGGNPPLPSKRRLG